MIAQGLERPITRAYLWRIRLGLLYVGLRRNWGVFARNRIGLAGLAIIGFYGMLAIAHRVAS